MDLNVSFANQRVTLRQPRVRAEFLGDIYFSRVSLRCVGSKSPVYGFNKSG